jgi:hypothetical protein
MKYFLMMGWIDMYLNDDLIERTVLRQGDILNNVHILGALNLNCIQMIGSIGKDPESWLYREKPIFGSAMVVSHSCEIDKSNGVKLTSIVLAPLRDIDSATSPEKKDELIASNFISDESTISFLKYFFLEPNKDIKYPSGAVVDFSKCFSLKKQAYDSLLEKKVIQLVDDVVEKMSLKLSLFYYRNHLAA